MEKPGEQIILCFIGLILSSCVDQLGGEVTLAGMVGGSITFPNPVEGDGHLLNSKGTITRINAGNPQTYNENYTDRISWDKKSGMFTLFKLNTADSGLYTVENFKEKVIATTYRLYIYEPVPAPTVNVSAVERQSCSLVCLLEETGGESSMLSWYRKDKLLNHTSSFYLPLVVDTQHYNSPHSCVSSNPVDNKTVSVNVATTCSSGSYKDNELDGDAKRNFVILPVVGLSALFLTMGIMVMVRRRRRRDKQSQDSAKRDEDEITYADVTVVQHRDQEEQWGLSEPPMDRTNLTTVYDKLEVHRMTLTETDTEAV